jgi:hypothetical protein
MQLERFKARNAVREAKQSGICEKRFEDRSREWRVLANGARLAAEIEVRLLSARLRCFKNLHFEEGNMPIDSRLDELPRGLCQPSDILECELPDPDLLTLYDPLKCPCADPVRELGGRTGELLLGLVFLGDLAPSDPERVSEAPRSSSSEIWWRSSGDPGAELEWTNSACGSVGLRFGLDDVAQVDVGDICAFEDRRRRLSISSSTMLIRRSAGSSTPARLTVKDLSCSASLSHPKNCRMSMSLISKALMFLNARRGTAVSKGNSS